MKINSKILNDNKKYSSESMFQNMYKFQYNSYIGINTITDSDSFLNRNLHIWIINNSDAPKLYHYVNIIDSVAIIIRSDIKNMTNAFNRKNHIIWLYNLNMYNFGIYHVTKI